MAGFRERLDKEIDRRNLRGDEAQDAPAPENDNSFVSNQRGFSLKSFRNGMVIGVALLSLLVFWAFFNADKTKQSLEEKIPSKTIIVEKEKTLEVVDVPPVKAVPPKDVEKMPSTTEDPKPAEAETPMVSGMVPGLFESTDSGLKPKVREKDGMSPFEAYKKSYTAAADKPLLSFVVTDMGLSSTRTRQIIEELPENISLSFSPYALDITSLTSTAKDDGHEIWLMLPLETVDYPLSDPGPFTLLKSASNAQNKDRLEQILTSVSGYAGFVPNKDHSFTMEDTKTKPSIQEVFSRGLAVIESKTGSANFVRGLATQKNYPFAKNDLWLDQSLTPNALNKKIREAIELSKAKGSAIVMLEPYPASINALKKFLSSSVAEEFQIAPVSAQVQYGE